MKKLALLGAGVGLAASALVVSHTSDAADHLDSPALATGGMADITDVYAWMTADTKKVNLIVNVSPAEGSALTGTHHFDNTVQYVIHVTSHPGNTNKMAFGAAGTESRVICTFESDTSVQCWVTAGTTVKDYVKGDPSATTGVQSTSHKLKVFAGKRSDPFFFNLAGLKTAIATVEGAAAGLVPDAAGCPSNVPAATAGLLRTQLSSTSATAVGPCAANQADCFANFNVMSLVVQVDADLVVEGTDHVFSVWASTHMAP